MESTAVKMVTHRQTWGCSGRLSPARGSVLPDEEESELIEMLSFLALVHRRPWGLPTQDREKRAGVEEQPVKIMVCRVL